MIIRMSKVEIVGLKQQLLAALNLLREKGVFHPETDIQTFVPPEDQSKIKQLLLDETRGGEHLFFVSLQERMTKLLACLPDLPSRTTYLKPLPLIEVLNELVDKHLAKVQNWQQQCQSLREEAEVYTRHLRFWILLEPLVAEVGANSQLVFFGVTLRHPDEVPILRAILETASNGRCHLSTASSEAGSVVGLIMTDKEMEDGLRWLLADEKVPELTLPDELAGLPFREKSRVLRERQRKTQNRLNQLTSEMTIFAQHWLPIYRQALSWLDERLALYQATTFAYETRQCFLVHGWMTTADVDDLQQSLVHQFQGQVVLHLLEMRQQDFERAPVLLRNPLYFKPFELLARLLPLPKYSSYDPTPFLGLSFPLLFGMILGDLGYGLLLAILAGLTLYFFPTPPNLADGAKILGVAAAYAILFGLLFGELFGNLGEQLFHLQPLWRERSEAIVPMIVFTLAVGSAHILLGLVLGIHYDFKRRLKREALTKISHLLLLALGGIWLLGQIIPALKILSLPLLMASLLLLGLLLIIGGFLAPLELIKSFGNIISYVRIMAIGLSSVLLAKMANQLGGMTGDLFTGLLVAGLLHLFNLVLGIFAPTVHALRLHYVEFFSKFLEFGGRPFNPLHKQN